MNIRKVLVVALLLTLVVTGWRFSATETSMSVTNEVSAGSFASVTAVNDGSEAWSKWNALPTWTPIEGQAGGITNGDLYYITNPVGYTGSLYVTLYFTNVGDLADAYSYLNLKVQAYDYASGSPGTWTSTNLVTYLTLANGHVSFTLPQASGDGYVITIDNGSYYCLSTSGDSLSPSYYIEVAQGN